MSRKKEPSFETEKEILPSRLTSLMKDSKTTQQKLAEAIGVTRQAISNYMLGQSAPDWKTLGKIAKEFDVSADYLIGLSEHKTPNADIRAMADLTGLSAEAISTLENAKSNIAGMRILNNLIGDNLYLAICLNYLSQISVFSNTIQELCKKNGNPKNTEEFQRFRNSSQKILDDADFCEFKLQKLLIEAIEQSCGLDSQKQKVRAIQDNYFIQEALNKKSAPGAANTESGENEKSN